MNWEIKRTNTIADLLVGWTILGIIRYVHIDLRIANSKDPFSPFISKRTQNQLFPFANQSKALRYSRENPAATPDNPSVLLMGQVFLGLPSFIGWYCVNPR